MKGTKVKSSKGITLVALVITIIILLILAIVAINAVNGDGIIGKAKVAGKSYSENAIAENTELARQLGLIEGAINSEEEIPTEDTSEDETPPGPTLASLGISNANIGDYIDLGNNIVGTETTSDDWRILYVNGTNVYAILAEYLPNNLIPDGDVADNIRKSEYHDNVWCDKDRTSLINNYLLNTNKWKSLSNEFSNNVTGGPTGEQLMNSYNAKHQTELDYNYGPELDTNDKLYFPSIQGSDTRGYWLASPDRDNEFYMWYVFQDGKIRSHTPDNGIFGVRPVISLTSNIQASKTGNVWTLLK